MAKILSSGTSLNNWRYTVKNLLGQGGMGAVYLAEDLNLQGRLVAVKENLDTTSEAQQQFQFEAQILANLQHPNLPRVSDCFIEPSGKQYLVMDFVKGDDLQELLDRQGPLPENQVVVWMQGICGALQYLHGQQPHPVIHRDLKPANVKITPHGQVVLVDFGIAKAHKPGKKTVAGARGVTPGYSPPEQYGTGTDARSDIYALGAMMYHLLTGQLPDESITITPSNPLVPPRSLNPGLSLRVEQITLKAMAYKPDQRYQTAQEMERALAAHVAPVVPSPILPGVACPICRAMNRVGAQSCRACGGSIAVAPVLAPAGVACLTCGANNRAGAQFCQSCGNPMGIAAPHPSPTPTGVCPGCGASEDPSETFCANCGFAWGPLPAALPPLAPVPIVAPAQVQPRTQEHRIAAWTLFGMGALTLLATLWLAGQGIAGALSLAIGLLSGLLALLAARDLLNLGSSYRYKVSPHLRVLFGGPARGRQLGVVAAALIAMVFIGQGWMVLPLVLVAVAGYTAKVLMSEQAVRAYGGSFKRPAGVTLIGWGLAFSGIGTLPGIALLIPKSWAKRGATTALIALAVLGGLICLGVIIVGLAVPASSDSLSQEMYLSFMGGTRVRAYAFAAMCYGLALVVGSLMGVRYLQDPGLKLAATQTSVRRELNVVGWILMGIGVFQLVGPFLVWPSSKWGLLPQAVVIIPAVLCLVAARDLLQLFQSQYYTLPRELHFLFGSVARGRVLGIIAAMASSVVFLGLSWLVIPIALAILMFYVIGTLMSPLVLAQCGASSKGPAGVTIIAWLLLPTIIGTLPGIAMLTAKPWARKMSIGALALLLAIGALVAALAVHQALVVQAHSSYLSQITSLPLVGIKVRSHALTVGAYALSLIVGCAFAIRYLQSPSIRSFFGA